ncbi:MAG: serine hydrolase [Spirosomataceae bacterium]
MLKHILINLFFCLCMQPLFAQMSLSELNKQVQERFAKVEGRFAVAYKDLQSGEMLLLNEKESFHAASTMKTPVMMEVYRQTSQGKFKVTDSLVVKNQFKSIVDGSPYSLSTSDDSADDIYKMIGHKMTIYDLVYQMITVSSNLATNVLIDLVDAKNANAFMRKLGAQDIQVLRGVEDTKAFRQGLNNSVTAYDLMLIFDKLSQRKVVSKKASDAMIKVLFDQKFNDLIPQQLPKEVKVAHKTGWITGVHHDSGIVYLPNGKKYVLVILSKQLKNEAEGKKAIADVSEAIYDYAMTR